MVNTIYFIKKAGPPFRGGFHRPVGVGGPWSSGGVYTIREQLNKKLRMQTKWEIDP